MTDKLALLENGGKKKGRWPRKLDYFDLCSQVQYSTIKIAFGKLKLFLEYNVLLGKKYNRKIS